MKFKINKRFFILLFLFTPCYLFAANHARGVVINEIAWMGTQNSHLAEWIELYNDSSSDIQLEAWKVISEDGALEVILKNKIPSKGFYLLERTTDQTLPEIQADLIYKGSLNNKGEHLKLLNNQEEIIDEIDCSGGWFTGNNATKQTMERKNPQESGNNPENWQSSKTSGGTPKENNIQLLEVSPPKAKEENQKKTGGPTSDVELKQESTVYPSNIFINELLPSPEGDDAKNEWVEIFNENDFEVDLSNWKIRDVIGATKTYTIEKGTKIGAKEFLVFYRIKTNITLQNGGDALEVLNPNEEIVDRVSYGKAPIGQSFNRTLEGWSWSESLTPGEKNLIKDSGTQTVELSQKQKEEKEKSGIKKNEEILTAKIGDELLSSSKNPIVIIVALMIGIASGLIALWLKKKITDKNTIDF